MKKINGPGQPTKTRSNFGLEIPVLADFTSVPLTLVGSRFFSYW